MKRLLGITVLGDFILNEGVDGVLDNLQKCGATAVACNPTVTAPSAEGEGSFQPPSDAGSSPRLFDRPCGASANCGSAAVPPTSLWKSFTATRPTPRARPTT